MNRLPERRAAARIAWRQARRAPWRTGLVLTTVALPIAALAIGLVLIRTILPTPDERATEAMGAADVLVVGWQDADPTSLAGVLPRGSRVAIGRTVYSGNAIAGAIVYWPLEEISVPVHRPPVRGMYRIAHGRAPTRPGEAAVHPDVLERMGAGMGDTIRLRDLDLRLRVTGTVRTPGYLREPVGVLGPGTLGEADDRRRLFADLPPGTSAEQVAGRLRSVVTAEDVVTRASVAEPDRLANVFANGAAFAAGALCLAATGLVAAAAFVIGARRQLRALGLVGAAGGEPRDVRAVVLLGGVVLGFVGSAIGAALGVLAAVVLHPTLDPLIGRTVGRLEVPALPLVGAVALGTIAAAVAAFGPARSAARLPTVDALAGRTAPPRPPGRLARRGAVLAVAGAAVTAAATVLQSRAGRPSSTLLAAASAGLAAMLGGFLLAIPLVAMIVGRLARLLPAHARIAARDVARHGRRTGAALAAATAVLALPVSISAVTLSDEAHERGVPWMDEDHLLVSHASTSETARADRAALLADLRRAVPGSLIAPLLPASHRPGPSAEQGREGFLPVRLEGRERVVDEGIAYRESGLLLVGDAPLLGTLHAEDGVRALRDGKVVLVGSDPLDGGTVRLVSDPAGAGGGSFRTIPAASAGRTRYASLGLGGELVAVISRRRADALGLITEGGNRREARWILRAPEGLDGDAIARARAAAARHRGAAVMAADDFGSDAGPVRAALLAAAGLFALATVAVIVALVGAESRRDAAILVAVGAGPRSRRTVAAARAALLAALAGALAVPAGFLPVVVVTLAQQLGRPVVVPWVAIGVATTAVPLAAAASAAAASRRPRASMMLRPVA